jgi:two-component system chemotaxis response regulator CheY
MIDFRLPILLVADESEARQALSRMLQTIGFANITQDDGSRALALLRQHAYGLVLSDMAKEPRHGLRLLHAAREAPGLAHLCFVMVTALADAAWVQAAREADVDFYLLKPFELDQLRRVLFKTLARTRSFAPAAEGSVTGGPAPTRARRTVRPPLRDDDPMMPIREDAVQLYHVYGHLRPPPGGEFPPWETAFMEWWRFMHRRALLVAMRSYRQGGQFHR